MHSTLDADDTDQYAQPILLWLFTTVVFSTAVLVLLVRFLFPSNEMVPVGLPTVLWISVFGLSLIWGRQLIAKTLPVNVHVGSLAALPVLLYMPWILVRVFPVESAQLITDVVIVLIAVGGIFTGIRSMRFRNVVLVGIFGFFLAAAFLLALMGKEYITPFAYENALASVQHRDTLYHSTVSAMIEYHGIASTGADGLVPHAYHVLSHRLIGSVGTWLEIPILQASYLTVMIVTVPLMFLLLCEAVLALRPQGWPPLAILPGIMFFLCWPMLFSLFQNSSYFASESYILSLILMFAVIPLLVEWGTNEPERITRIGYAAALSILIALAASAKISTGAVMAAGLSAFVVIAGRFSIFSFLLAILFCIAPFLLVFSSSWGAGGGTSGIISPLHFLFERREQALFYIVLAAVTGLVIWRFMNGRNGSWRVIVPLYLMALAAVFASLLLKLPAGAAIYFVNPSMWICILLLAALLPGPSWAGNKTPTALFVIALAAFIGLSAVEKDRWFAVESLIAQPSANESSAAEIFRLNASISNQIEKQIAESGRGFLVFVSPDFDAFWGQNEICWAQSFVIPGLTGQPMLKGLPSKISACEISPFYGFSDYDFDVSRTEDLTDEQLCAAAKARRFNAVLRFDNQMGRFMDCDN